MGFTHPKHGHWLMFPAIEFEAILALERKAVAQVVLFVMQRTLGVPNTAEGRDEDGHIKRREWSPLVTENWPSVLWALLPR